MVILEGQKCYTVAEAAEILNVGQSAVRQAINRGSIEATAISGKPHITESELKAYDLQRKGRKHG